MALSTLSVLILVLICFVFVLMLIIYIVFRKISKNMRDIHTTDAVHAREEPVTKFGVVHSAESSPSTQSGGSINQSREGQARALKDLAPWVEEPVDRWSEQQQLASIVRMKVSAEKATDAPSRQYSRTTIDQQLLAMRDATVSVRAVYCPYGRQTSSPPITGRRSCADPVRQARDTWNHIENSSRPDGPLGQTTNRDRRARHTPKTETRR
eukprot:m.323439 g.323439  ORF g.323439 m.323439 type:complete len:210 (+) comp16455_c0_seq55:354-983(+)